MVINISQSLESFKKHMILFLNDCQEIHGRFRETCVGVIQRTASQLAKLITGDAVKSDYAC